MSIGLGEIGATSLWSYEPEVVEPIGQEQADILVVIFSKNYTTN